MALKYHPLEVIRIEPTAQDAVCITLGVSPELRDEFKFESGQHLTFQREINGEPLRRFYSICSPAGGEELRIGVRKIENGRFSGFFNSGLKPGDLLNVLKPRGRFCLDANSRGKHILALAAGSGITPVYSILHTHLARDPHATATLVFGNRNTKNIMLREDLDDLKDTFLDRFQIIHMLSRERQDMDILNGRIDQKSVAVLINAGLISPQKAVQIFICGPADMIDTAQEAIVASGVAPDIISVERFTAIDNTPAKVSQTAKKVIAEGAKISFVLDGAEHEFEINDPNDTVLSAAEKSGFELPFSCAGGMCATCRCKLVEGEVEMAKNYALEPWEIESGFVLACQSRPKTKRIRLDFDVI